MKTDRKVTVILLLFIGVMGALWVVGPLVFAGRDDPTAIDNKAVRKTVEAACTQLRADLAAVPAGVSAADRAEAENRAVEQLIGRVRALSPEGLARDVPVERWLGDWERIVAARRQAVQEGKRFTTPVEGGAPINVRMYALVRSGLGTCDVPPALLAPEPGRV
ncbi:MAG: hypothetical protein ACRDYF_13890 [Acidimicrobiia bacterium]